MEIKDYTIVKLLAALSCTLVLQACVRDNPIQTNLPPVHVVEAQEYAVPMDSIGQPDIIRVNVSRLQVITGGDPKVVPVNSNTFPASMPEVVSAGKPVMHTPGMDSFALPEIIPITKTESLFHEPEIALAKDRVSKDRNPFSFSSFGKLQGLKHNVINCLMQDKTGSIWIGTAGGGATKYDGKYFTHFTDQCGLLSNSVLSIMQDRKGDIWFGTDSGICVYNGKSFSTIEDDASLTTSEVHDILEDRDGNIWFAFSHGMMKYMRNDTNTTGSDLFLYFSPAQGLPHPDVRDLFEDNAGVIWIAMRGGGVGKYDGTSIYHLGAAQGLSTLNIECIAQDADGHMWFGTNDKGVITYDGKHFNVYTDKQGLSTHSIFSILTDSDGNIWLCSLGGGVFKYNGHHFIRFMESEGLSNNSVVSFLEDSSGNLWMGTDGGGVNLFQGNAFVHFTEFEGLSNNSVFSILRDKDDHMWFGTYGGGVSRFDGEHFSQYSEAEGLSGSAVYSMCQDKRGHLWIGTNGGGVSRFDGRRFVHYNVSHGLCNDVVLSAFEDRHGNLWFGTRGGGVSRFAPDQIGNGGTFTNYNTSSGLSSDLVFALREDSKGNLWMGTGRGVTRYDGTRFSHFAEKEGLTDAYVLSILEDRNGNIWFGTMGAGVVRYDGEYFVHLTDKEGLSNNVVLSIGEDQAGVIWMGTRFGLSSLRSHVGDTSTTARHPYPQLSFENYDYDDGFLGIGCWRNSMYIDDDNVIYIGSNDRLTLHYPGSFHGTQLPPDAQIMSIDLYNEHIDWVELEKNRDTTLILGNGVPLGNFFYDDLSAWYNLPVHLELSYQNNYINFNFIGITMHQPALVRYQYKLDGLDENWSAITSRNSAPYGNLPHGTFTFMVKAQNSKGEWSEPFSYTFTIRPPWWKTWWAYGSYLMLFILGVWRIHLAMKAYTIRKEREKTQKRELEQAREIEKAYQELKATQAQLILAEKMASLGELTAGIAHEIQNPLNFVNNFSEVNTELIDELKGERRKANGERQEDIENTLLNDISQNLEKIAFHGKRADAIVKSMLQHSRSSSGQKELTDINALADEYLRLAYHGYRARDKSFHAQFETDFDPTLPKIEVIPQDIGRVLLNLINNAFYACSEMANGERRTANGPSTLRPTQRGPSSGTSVEAKVTVTTINLRDKIEIRVKDNGNGIPQHVFDKIFQPFFTTKPTGQGTGLGLSLSYDIIKAHGGDIKVETKENEGTTFIIELPK